MSRRSPQRRSSLSLSPAVVRRPRSPTSFLRSAGSRCAAVVRSDLHRDPHHEPRQDHAQPQRRARASGHHGPFSITRNPIYLANTLLMIGVGLISGIAWFLPLRGHRRLRHAETRDRARGKGAGGALRQEIPGLCETRAALDLTAARGCVGAADVAMGTSEAGASSQVFTPSSTSRSTQDSSAWSSSASVSSRSRRFWRRSSRFSSMRLIISLS